MTQSRDTPQERAQRLIDASINMTVATVDAAGTPWVSPVFYVPDAEYDLYWTSERTARHSVNIRATAKAAIVIVEADPDRRVDAVYMSAEVAELTEAEDVARAMEIMLAKPQPDRWKISDASDVSGEGPWRIYQAHATTMDVRESAEAGGRAVARRTPAEFRATTS